LEPDVIEMKQAIESCPTCPLAAGPIHVYLAGPISSDPMGGTRAAVLAAAELDDRGFACFVPHRSVLDQMIKPREYESWMRVDFAWLARCDALLRLPGESSGADREMVEAERLGIPVFQSRAALLEWAKRRDRDWRLRSELHHG
jgi:nucleoside 2-deoxyribosyltransferase